MSKSSAPPPMEVRIVPCIGIDLTLRDLVVTTGFIVDARLDPKKLEDSIEEVVERKFPRAGARLALRDGVFEFHIPETFDADAPAVEFTSEYYPEVYAWSKRPSIDHLRGKSSAFGEPWICEQPALERYFKGRSCPRTTDEFLAPYTPLLHVHVAIFDDLTFIGVTSTHIAFDAIGVHALLHAWTRSLAGDVLDDIPGMAWNVVPFESFNVATRGKQPRGWFDIGKLGKMAVTVRSKVRTQRDPKEEGRLVRIPKAFLEKKKCDIMEELKVKGSSEWVSTSDVLMAWWFKTTYSHRTDSTPLHIQIPANVREIRIFPGASRTMPRPYVSNALSFVPIPPFPANTFKTRTLSELALHIRRAINAWHADLEGIVADVRWRCHTGTNPLRLAARALSPCPPTADASIQMNWRASRFSELDFSGALAETEDKRPARLIFVMPGITTAKDISLRGFGVVLEDESTIWMSQVRGSKDWEAVKSAGGVQFLQGSI